MYLSIWMRLMEPGKQLLRGHDWFAVDLLDNVIRLQPNFENRPLGASVATSWTPVPTVYCQPVYTTVKQQALISKTVRILICRRLINVCGSSTAMNNRVTVLIRPQLRNG